MDTRSSAVVLFSATDSSVDTCAFAESDQPIGLADLRPHEPPFTASFIAFLTVSFTSLSRRTSSPTQPFGFLYADRKILFEDLNYFRSLL
jgi:hypothetical protein